MKHPAELAVNALEKKGFALTTAALITAALAAAPTLTRGLNWITGHDPKKKVQQSQAAAKMQQGQPPPGAAPGMMPPGQMPPGMMPPRPMPMRLGMMPPGMMPHGMLASARGLHNYRAGQPGV